MQSNSRLAAATVLMQRLDDLGLKLTWHASAHVYLLSPADDKRPVLVDESYATLSEVWEAVA